MNNQVNSYVKRHILVPDGIWLGAFVEKYFEGVLILASVLFVLYREALVVERLRRLPRMQEVVGSNHGVSHQQAWGAPAPQIFEK